MVGKFGPTFAEVIGLARIDTDGVVYSSSRFEDNGKLVFLPWGQGRRGRRLGTLRRGRGHERLAAPRASTFSRVPFLHRLQPAELEPRELDAPLRAHRQEAEVGEEVRREDRPVDVEALEVRLPFRIAVGERLERAGARARARRRSR